MSGGNLLPALFYRFSDKLYDLGLVNGISRKDTRPFLCGAAVVFTVVWLGGTQVPRSRRLIECPWPSVGFLTLGCEGWTRRIGR